MKKKDKEKLKKDHKKHKRAKTIYYPKDQKTNSKDKSKKLNKQNIKKVAKKYDDNDYFKLMKISTFQIHLILS